MQPIDAALDAALIVMQNGGSAAMADRTFTNILKGCKQEGASAVWRLDFIAVTNTVDGQSSTFLRPVGAIGTNLVRASEAGALAERVAKGEVSLATFWQPIRREVEATALAPVGCWLPPSLSTRR